MKRIISILLCACMLLTLWGCNQDNATAPTTPPETTGAATAPVEPTDPSAATQPSVPEPLSQESVLELPQVGEYAESIFLANVPNQASGALLSVRSDGTVDYIFSTQPYVGGESDRGIPSVAEAGFQYYTITPDGEATRQPSDWLDQLDEAVSTAMEEMTKGNNTPYCFVKFSAWEGDILIWVRLVGDLREPNSQHGILYRLKDNVLTQIPFSLANIMDGKVVSLTPGDVYGVFVSENVFLIYGNTGFENAGDTYSTCSCLVYSYDGTYLGRKIIPYSVESRGITAAGGESIWAVNDDGTELIQMRVSDFSEAARYPIELTNAGCSAVTPDSSTAYILRFDPNTRSDVRLSRFGEQGEEPVTANPMLYAFSDYNTMPSLLAAANDGIFYTWSVESGRGILRQYRYNPEGARETKTATVYSLEANQTVQTAVTLWNRTHTDVTFEYVVAADEIDGTALTLEDAITQLNTQLVNGEGPDVLILDGLPADSIIDKGFLHPLTGLDTTGVYPKLLERFSLDGTLYAVPGKMTPYLLGRDLARSEPVESLEDFADYVESATRVLNGSQSSDMGAAAQGEIENYAVYYVEAADQVFDLWYPAWSDEIWEEGSFQPEVYREFLTQTGRLVEHYSLSTSDEIAEYKAAAYGWNAERLESLKASYATVVNKTDNPYRQFNSEVYPYCLAAKNYVGIDNFCPDQYTLYIENYESLPCEIVGIPGPGGTGATVPTCIAAVREGGNTEAGVGLLQLILSDEVQCSYPSNSLYGPVLIDGYPVKWSCTPTLLAATAACYAHSHRSPVKGFDIENDFEAALSDLDPVILYELPYSAAKEVALRYYEGKLTAQEAADQVAEATAIYLAEQRR